MSYVLPVDPQKPVVMYIQTIGTGAVIANLEEAVRHLKELLNTLENPGEFQTIQVTLTPTGFEARAVNETLDELGQTAFWDAGETQ